jgi:hypothetical protein
MRAARVSGLMLLALVLVTAGCTTYYRVTDPSSGKVFYTDEITRGSQNIRFKDAKSGSDVTLTTSEVKEIAKYRSTASTSGAGSGSRSPT